MSMFLIGSAFGVFITCVIVALADRFRDPYEVCRCYICEPCNLRRLID